jgi:hypothetical protein
VYSAVRTAVLQYYYVKVQTVYSAVRTAMLQYYYIKVQTVYSAVRTAVLQYYYVKVQTVYSAVRTAVLIYKLRAARNVLHFKSIIMLGANCVQYIQYGLQRHSIINTFTVF